MPATAARRYSRLRAAAAVIAVFCAALTAHVHAQAQAADSDPMTLNLKDADIRAFIASMSELTGRNFVVDPRVQGKVTVISAMPTDPDKLYDVFLSILKVQGYTAVPSGDIVKILPEAAARTEGGETQPGGDGAGSERTLTRVLELHHIKAAELVPVLKPLLPAEAHIAAHASSNAIVVADTATNIDRIARIVERIDRKTDRAIEVIPLRHASAEELARVIMSMRPQSPEGGVTPAEQPTLVADKRTNTILLGGDPSARLELRALISHLDTPVLDTGDTEVIYLRYAEASNLVPILQQVATKGEARNGATAGGEATAAAGGTPGLLIQADDATNALVIQAPPDRLRSLKAIVQALDVRRAQVFVEGVIAEVGENKAAELGIQWRTDDQVEGKIGGVSLPGVDAGGINAFPGDPVSLATGLTLGYLKAGNIRVLLRALAGDAYTNVLSTPTLVTLDNEEAEITVGQNVPFVTGQYSNNTTTPDNPFQTFERKDVGVLLKVKPQINEGDAVKLQIEQEVSSVERGTAGPELVTNKRAIKTNVLVDDGQIIVIGGLISDDLQEAVQKVPLLGDIPVLGNLFRNRRSDVVKTNLMVFLRPTIVRDGRLATDLSLGKYSLMRDRQAPPERLQGGPLPKEPSPRLPEITAPAAGTDARRLPGFMTQ